MYFNTAPEVLCMTCKTDQFKKQKDYIQVEKKNPKTPKQTKLNATNCDFKFGSRNLFTSCYKLHFFIPPHVMKISQLKNRLPQLAA